MSSNCARQVRFTFYQNLFAGALFALGAMASALAANVTIHPVADTSLVELVPTNNLGAQPHFNAGTTLNGTRNRGLIRFDPAAHMPPGSKIKSAQLIVEVVGMPVDMPENDEFHLHRLLKPWGEGSKFNLDSPGRGEPATANEATWEHRFAFTTNTWDAPGAAETNDYSPLSSGSQYIVGVNDSPYTFNSSSRLVADLQNWLDDPASNFGWLLKPNDETTFANARRFGSREDPLNTPRLEIEYVPPPQIVNATLNAGQLEFSFLAEADQPYAVEFANALSATNAWIALTNIAPLPEPALVTVTNDTSGSRFFRIAAP